MKSKKPVVIAPLVPLTFIVTYFGDLAYGPKMARIRGKIKSRLTSAQIWLAPLFTNLQIYTIIPCTCGRWNGSSRNAQKAWQTDKWSQSQFLPVSHSMIYFTMTIWCSFMWMATWNFWSLVCKSLISFFSWSPEYFKEWDGTSRHANRNAFHSWHRQT